MTFAWFLLAGCVTTVRFPPDLWAWDSGGRRDTAETTWTGTSTTTPEPIRAWGVSGGCDVDNVAFTYVAVATGWVGGGALNAFRSDGVTEEHLMRVVRSDPGGTWDELQVGPLMDGVDPAVQQPGLDTRFDCELDSADLTFTVRIHDAQGVLLDCIVWGADPMAATAAIRTIDPGVLALGGCRLVEP